MTACKLDEKWLLLKSWTFSFLHVQPKSACWRPFDHNFKLASSLAPASLVTAFSVSLCCEFPSVNPKVTVPLSRTLFSSNLSSNLSL